MAVKNFHAPAARQRGLTLLELSLSIAASLIILGIGIGTYSATNASSRGLKVANETQALAAGIREAYANVPTYAGISAATLINMGKAPRHMVNGSQLVSSFNTPINGPFATTVSGGATNGSFRFEILGVPREQCVALVMASAPSFDYVYVGPHNGSTFTSGYHVKHQQLGREPSMTDVSTWCNHPITGVQLIGR